jgi:choline-glycine betaine transporter
VAAAPLLAGGLGALQAGSILTGLPLALSFMALSLRKGLHEEWLEELCRGWRTRRPRASCPNLAAQRARGQSRQTRFRAMRVSQFWE